MTDDFIQILHIFLSLIEFYVDVLWLACLHLIFKLTMIGRYSYLIIN